MKNPTGNQGCWRFRAGLNQITYKKHRKIKMFATNIGFGRFSVGLNQLKYKKEMGNLRFLEQEQQKNNHNKIPERA